MALCHLKKALRVYELFSSWQGEEDLAPQVRRGCWDSIWRDTFWLKDYWKAHLSLALVRAIKTLSNLILITMISIVQEKTL